MNPQSTGNELDWLAYCYVAGELQGEQAVAFERRLGEDQFAREALARVVELSLALAAAEVVEPSRKPAVAVRRSEKTIAAMLWGGLGIVACVALLVVGVSGQPTTAGLSGELAERWSETLAVPRVENDWLEEEEHFADSSEEPSEELPGEFLPQAPEWMLAAVSGLKQRDDMMNEMDLMNESQEQ